MATLGLSLSVHLTFSSRINERDHFRHVLVAEFQSPSQ